MTQAKWDQAGNWYDSIVGQEGHYYHQTVILPNLLNMMDLKAPDLKVLDIGCGQGVLERKIPASSTYFGVDASSKLIKLAKGRTKCASHQFQVVDVTDPKATLAENDFSCAVMILCLQNMSDPEKALAFASRHLKKGAPLYLVLNHPTFRIPRQSSWGLDEKQKIQYRRIDRYLSSLSIPIMTKMGNQDLGSTESQHFALSTLFQWLFATGFVTEQFHEWVSDKKSTGSAARMENRARTEFPLFLALKCIKI